MSLLGCGNHERNLKDYNADDFYAVQGIVYKITRTPVTPRYHKINVYYVYNLDASEPKLGKELDVDLVVQAGEPCTILVYKGDDNISFIGRGRVVDKEVLNQYIIKSKELGVEYYGVN